MVCFYTLKMITLLRSQCVFILVCVSSCMELQFEPPVITSFFLNQWNSSLPGKKMRQDLLNGKVHQVTVKETSDTVNIICEASGYPEPEVIITHDNMTCDMRSRGSVVIEKPTCNHAGVYKCQAKNNVSSTQTQKQIQMSLPEIRQGGKTNRTHITMNCSVEGCPEPVLLTVSNDINQTVVYAAASDFLVHEMTNVRCSDIGTYFCRAEIEDGRILEKRDDIFLSGCPVQLCRSEGSSTIITGAVNQTVQFSVCLMSPTNASWENSYQFKNIYVDLTQNTNSRIYWTASITIFNISDLDNGTKTITIRNKHGAMDYNFTLNVQSTSEESASSDHQEQASEKEVDRLVEGRSSKEEIDLHYIWPPIVFGVLIFIAVVGVLICQNSSASQCASSSAVSTHDSSYEENDEVTYANLKRQEATTSLQDSGRAISEEGLVYITVVHTDNTENNNPKQAKKKFYRAKQYPEDRVEYVTLDFEKSGQFMISEMVEGKSKNQTMETGGQGTSENINASTCNN